MQELASDTQLVEGSDDGGMPIEGTLHVEQCEVAGLVAAQRLLKRGDDFGE